MKRADTALVSFLKLLFTKGNSLISKTSKASLQAEQTLSLIFSYQRLKAKCFRADTKYY